MHTEADISLPSNLCNMASRLRMTAGVSCHAALLGRADPKRAQRADQTVLTAVKAEKPMHAACGCCPSVSTQAATASHTAGDRGHVADGKASGQQAEDEEGLSNDLVCEVVVDQI